MLCQMETEFVAKSAALVGRMTVAAAQANLLELRSELETLQDLAHMLTLALALTLTLTLPLTLILTLTLTRTSRTC